MACKSLLLWIQPRQQFVGEVDFGNVPMNEDYYHLSNEECEDECEEEIYDAEDELEETIGHGRDVDGGKISESAAFCHDDVSVKNGGPPVLANSIMNFLVTGLTKRYSALVGCWPVARLTGRQLFFLTIHVIRKLEEIGFKVVRVVGDNAKVNVKLFKLLRRATDAEDFQVTHPADPSRHLFLSFDPTHLLKNIRNQMIDRPLKWDGELINFSLITLLFTKTMHDGLALCRYLTRRHVDPTNFERMKVSYARDIFRPETVAALRSMHDLGEIGFQKVEPLVKFLEYFWKWYNYHDICNPSQHYRQREASKKPFSDEYDERIQELDEEIPELLKKWNKEKKSAMECFTKETLEAIIFTSRSTANCVTYLLNGGFQFVLTRRFTTDNIERFHGAIRNYCGNNDHPSVGQCLSAIERINRTQLAITSMSCNTP